MGDKKYKNYGAYCLILYRCDTCGKQEMVWNSRDGDAVSPIECRRHDFFCGLMWRDQKSHALHVPNFDPPDTSRVLISKKSSNDTMVVSGKEYKALVNDRQMSSILKGEDKMKIEITEAEGRINEVIAKLDEIEHVKLEPVSSLLPKLEAEKEKLFALYAENEKIVSSERGKALRSMGAFSKDVNNERIKLLERKDEVEAIIDQLKLTIEKAESNIPKESRTVKLKSVLKYFLIGGFIFIVFLKDPTISLYLAVLVVLAWLTDRYIT